MMKQEDIIKVIENSINNFLIEFFTQNFLENGKYDTNVISFGVLLPEFEYFFLVKEINEDIKENVDEMLFEVLAECGYHFNLNIRDNIITSKKEYKELLKIENFECVFIRPDYNDFIDDCIPMFWNKITTYFKKYVYPSNDVDISH